jgi:quercetin dioxygenase-like cupin family protein
MIQSYRLSREIIILVLAGAALAGAAMFVGSATMHHGVSSTVHHATPADRAPMMAGQGKITATKVSEEKLSHVPGKTVTVEIVEFPPGAIAAEHHHGGSVTAYILSGTLRSQLAGGPLIEYKPGESFFEPPGAIHVFAENPSATEPARFMAIHIADDGAQLTVFH